MTNNKNLIARQLKKAKSAPHAAATLTAEQAAEFYAKIHPESGALSDAELDKVAGGWEDGIEIPKSRICPFCYSERKLLMDSGLMTYYTCLSEKCGLISFE